MIAIGHPTGNPNSHNAALAHAEAGLLDSFIVPWMPSAATVAVVTRLSRPFPVCRRLSRRHFPPLRNAPLVQGRLGELRRLALRAIGRGGEHLSYEANDWIAAKLADRVAIRTVSAVHGFEDASLAAFLAAKRAGKYCIYDMPIGFYPEWVRISHGLSATYEDWIPQNGAALSPFARPQQKKLEMEAADLVLAPSDFVKKTIHNYVDKPVMVARYGVDHDFWRPGAGGSQTPPQLRFIYAGQLSLRKGTPLLLAAWRHAALRDATLTLVGPWQLAEGKKHDLPRHVKVLPPCSAHDLRDLYQQSDVFLFPSFFEGFGLVLLEALACGLPAIATTATAGPDILDDRTGIIIEPGDVDGLSDALRWCSDNRHHIQQMKWFARQKALQCTWSRYRQQVSAAVATLYRHNVDE